MKQRNKSVFLGEFGVHLPDRRNQSSPIYTFTKEMVHIITKENHKSDINKHAVLLGLYWIWEFPNQNSSFSIYPGLDDDTISVLQQTQKQKQTGISKQKRQTNPLRPLVGSNYFSGWWQGEGNKWIDSPVHNTSWLTQYPNRQPLLGQYNNQSTMDKEILSASSHGIDFFQMLWYNIYNQSDQTGYRTDLSPGSQYLNTGVQTFTNSSVAHQMSFYISFCNNAWKPELINRQQWTNLIQNHFLPAMKHPSYLTIGGRLVFKMINAISFYQDQCQNQTSCVASMMNELRASVRQANLGEIIIGAGIDDVTFNVTSTQTGYQYDWFGQYGTVPSVQINKLKPSPHIYPSKVLNTFNTLEREQHIVWATKQSKQSSSSSSVGPYLPLVMTGWDAIPWGGEGRPRFLPYTVKEWIDILIDVQKQIIVSANVSAGFPLPGGRVQPAFSIYCWNEFGEGGMLAPTTGLGSSRIEGIKQVFGVGSFNQKKTNKFHPF
jgi:hypothetical protein